MTLRQSPTLSLAASVSEARARGAKAFSLSTPTFRERFGHVPGSGASTMLSPALGIDGLRERCRQLLFAKWDLPRHETLITAGAKAAILVALRAVCSPGDRILIVAPSWPTYADLARLLYLEPIFLDTRLEDGFAVDPDRLTGLADRYRPRAVVFSNPGNPTGRIVTRGELEAVSRLARDRGSLMLVDESFSGVVFEPDLWNASVCADYERLVVVGSLSKGQQLQGLRIGACLARGATLESMVSAHQTVMSAAPSLSQSVALDLLSEPDQPSFGETRSLALAALEERGWQCAPSEGGFYLFPRVPDLAAFESHARERNVFLLRGEEFGEPYRDHFRLCFGMPPDTFREILRTLGSPGSSCRAAA